VVLASCATRLPDEPPQPAASRASPALASIVAALRTPTSVAAVPVPTLKMGRPSAGAQDR
jgi:hypothetical protein